MMLRKIWRRKRKHYNNKEKSPEEEAVDSLQMTWSIRKTGKEKIGTEDNLMISGI